jgi:hypothetical protein
VCDSRDPLARFCQVPRALHRDCYGKSAGQSEARACLNEISIAIESHRLRAANRSFRPCAIAWFHRPLWCDRIRCGWSRLAAMLAVLAMFGVPAALAQVATTTTLALSSSTVAIGTAVTFTATVSNGSAVTLGTVIFCNAADTYCLNQPALLGTAQLTSAGTAIIHLTPGIGVHSYKAVFKGTTANAASTSPAQELTVTGLYPTTTAISSSGSVGNYTLTGTVVGTGSLIDSPTGDVSFLDTSNSDYSPAAGTIPAIGLDTLTVLFTPAASAEYTAATASVVLTVGDFFSLNFGGSPIQTVQPGASASYSLTVAPIGLATLPGEVTYTATGLPPGATITFSPATIPAGSPATEVAVTIHTSSQQAANTGSSQRSQGPIALGMLLLPMLGIVGLRKRLGKMPQLRAAVVLGVLSLGAIMGLTGCGGGTGTAGTQPTYSEYTVVVTAQCGTLEHSANVTIKVEN